ncbi:MAG: PTS sugar transporter subunit IIA [Ignavibacteria bacterium]|jgi:fructose-specific phosphotransferase system IIA component|nr:PTS sugar transporter subunit IIA [Ignavibacteria bacterium]MDH7528853.1 PTS sugar transporter subunit IIA [Ignavibacteria bacterium]NPV11205.1 PTS sugar transporter subunit IIA [Ignavibacteria bacterium]
MKVSEYLNEENVLLDVEAKDKYELIDKLIDVAAKSGKILDKEKVREAVYEREKILSTGVGKGFAVPHGKTDAVNDIVLAFAITKEPLDYQALDNQPVRLVMLMVGKDSLVSSHIKLLSRISRLMNNDEFRENLLNAKTKEEVLEIFRKEESNYFDV